MRRVGSVGDDQDHRVHDHVVTANDLVEPWRELLVRYLEAGVAAEDQLLYVGVKRHPGLLDDLRGLPGLADLLASGQLRLRSLPVGAESGSGAAVGERVDQLREDVAAAGAGGYRCLRLASDGSGLADTTSGASHQLIYEVAVDQLIATTPMLSLCGYDHHALGEQAHGGLRLLHPQQAGEWRASLHAVAPGRWALAGEVDAGNVDALQVALDTLAAFEATDPSVVHLDVGRLEFLGAAGARALVDFAGRLLPSRRLVLGGPSEIVRSVLGLGWFDAPGLEIER